MWYMVYGKWYGMSWCGAVQYGLVWGCCDKAGLERLFPESPILFIEEYTLSDVEIPDMIDFVKLAIV